MSVQLVEERRYDQIMKDRVLPDLASCRSEGWMISHDGGEDGGTLLDKAHLGGVDPSRLLHYVCYDRTLFRQGAVESGSARVRGAVIISFGFSEFADKYQEMAWYFLMQGYSVCIPEHWGHGFSGRGVSDPSLVWVDHWQRYVADLAAFCSQVGQQYAQDNPMVLYAHSMGGGVAARMLETFPSLIDKAVLSSPMIAPRTGFMPSVAWTATNAACMMGRSRSMAPGFGPFRPELDMGKYPNGSQARVSWTHKLRAKELHYQTSAATFGWVRESLEMSRAILRPDRCSRVETPLLLFQAQPDRFVLPMPQNRFVDQVQQGGCQATLVRIPGSMHELYQMPDKVLGPYLERIFDFFDQPWWLADDR